MVKDTLANTSFGAALVAAGSTSGLAIGSDSRSARQAVIIVATAVTVGATLKIETKHPNSDNWAPVARFDITANGSYAVPARARDRAIQDSTQQVRVTCESRTDGSYACSLGVLTKG